MAGFPERSKDDPRITKVSRVFETVPTVEDEMESVK